MPSNCGLRRFFLTPLTPAIVRPTFKVTDECATAQIREPSSKVKIITWKVHLAEEYLADLLAVL